MTEAEPVKRSIRLPPELDAGIKEHIAGNYTRWDRPSVQDIILWAIDQYLKREKRNAQRRKKELAS